MHNAGKCYDRNIFNQHIKKKLTDTIKSMKGEHKEHSSPFSSLPGMHIQIPVCKVMQDREEDMACKPPEKWYHSVITYREWRVGEIKIAATYTGSSEPACYECITQS